MRNAWVDHIRAFAAKHKVPYGCALSNPECRKTYKSKKPTATQLLDDVEGIDAVDYDAMHAFVEKKIRRNSPEDTLASVLKKFGYSYS